MTLPPSEYECYKCGSRHFRERPRPVLCPTCRHHYLTWVNAEWVLTFIHRTDPDFIERMRNDS